MRILDIVSSNVVTDPRVTKQLSTISKITDDYIAIGKMNHLATKNSLKNYPFKYKLFGKTEKNESIPKKLIRRALFGLQVIYTIRKFKPDIIHANDFDVLMMVSLSGYKEAKVIFDAHEIYAKNPNIERNLIVSKAIEMLEKKFIKKVDAFITVSNAAKEYYISKGYPKEPTVITNVPLKEEVKLETSKAEKFEVVYQGQIVPFRGYEEFLMAGQYIKDSDIELVVRGFGPIKEQLLQEKKDNNIMNVRFDQPVELSQLVNKLTESHVGVILTKPVSLNYGLTVSNKIFECIHAGLPVILSPVKEHIYLNEKYKFGLILEEVTPKAIAEAVVLLKNDKNLYNKLKKNAEKSINELNWQKESKKLINIYSKAEIE